SKFKPEDVGRMTIGARVQAGQGAGVVHFNRAVTVQDFADASQWVKKSVGRYEMSVSNRVAICRIDDRTVAVGEEAALREVLERDGPAKLSDELTAAMNEVDFSKSLALAGSLKNLAKAAGPAGVSMSAMPLGPDAIRGGALQADVGDDIRLKAVAICKDAATADQLKKMGDGMLAAAKMNLAKMPPEAGKILNSVDFSNSGPTIRASAMIEVDTVLSLVDSFKGLGGQFARSADAPGNSAPRPNGFNPAPAQPSGPPTKMPLFPGNGGGQPIARNNPPNAGDNNPLRNPGNFRPKTSEEFKRGPVEINLKRIALAMHSYSDAQGHFPAAAICDPQGKPLLSWRVAILPYLGQQNLYKQFQLDQTWDSLANKRLLPRMPAVYRSPFGKPLGEFNRTTMLVPVGTKFAFFGQHGRKLADFTDGLSQTILVVEAAPDRAVQWTKPDDLAIDESDPSAGLFGERDGGFMAAMADGDVKFIPQAASKRALRALFTINGGDQVPLDFRLE
ncbi:MAG TPA: DUF1559 domain-containing protein, partial [Pirellulales bacterium]|nr:DUF1559 domain-containing protein [Pirellulales bacterium]